MPVVVVLAIFILPQAIRILREYERGVIFRLGKLQGAKGPGIIFLIPIVDKMVQMDLRVVTIDVPKQEIMTKDNVPATVDAVIYFRVVDPNAAVVKVENYLEGDLAHRADDLAQRARPVARWTNCFRNATSSTRNCRRSLTSRPSRGASRSRRSR